MEDSKKSSVPAWQQAGANADATSDSSDSSDSPNSTSETENITLEHARRFLDDEAVKAAAPEEKRAFLKSKGLDDAQITQLLDEPREEGQSAAPPSAIESSTTPRDVDRETDARPDSNEASSPPADSSPAAAESTPDDPSPAASFATSSPAPIITYPEFLTKPQRPPPLITPSRLANIIAVSGGVWALLYGISGLVVRPMVDNLNEARSDYYEHVNEKLSQLVEKLEGAVSEVPYKNGKPLKSQLQDRAMDDNESITSDPTELFHRDVGTQTSSPPSIVGTTSNTSNNSEKPVDVQANRLSAISASLRELTAIYTQKAENNADLRSAIGEIRDQVDKLAYPPVQDFSTFGGLGYGQSAGSDDEFKKTKDAIRSVKGIFLSSRSFPAVATR
ncbi:peroxisomal membrane anchor protein conserved region-domain-containing protein [Xylaria cf. heliscus]|nr:peroxisomal membrane anchor protein conserved region-domain-containing protein [Xylaria cf. heliscus]